MVENPSQVSCSIFDAAGREVKTFTSGLRSAGAHDMQWDRSDNYGATVKAGVYFVRVQVNQEEAQAKLILIK